ncbi:MAG: sugar phosphate isomerase/epimerase [Planctomycetales bacterium]
MLSSCVTISLVEEARGGPFVFWSDLANSCQTAKEIGFDAVEIFAPGPDTFADGQLERLLNDLDLKLAALGTGGGWVIHGWHLCSPDSRQRAKAIDFIRSMIDVAGRFGAMAIIGSMQGRHGDDVDKPTAIGYLREALQQLGEHAQQYELPLIYEPLNRYETNLINTMAESVAFLNSLQTENVRLLADLFHMNIEESSIATAVRTAGQHLGHIHLVDSNRQAAGLGHIDYDPIAEAVRDIGYSGTLSAEALPHPTPEDAARQTIETYRKYFS